MLRSAASKVMWVGRATVFLVGLAVILALVFGAASVAFGEDGDFFRVGRSNLADSVSRLTKSGAGPALDLRVDSGPPLAVNRQARVDNLNADKLDGMHASELQEPRGYAQVNATTADEGFDPSRSKGVIDITRPETGLYCFDLSFEDPKAVVASDNINNNATVGTALGNGVPAQCQAPYYDAAAKTYAANDPDSGVSNEWRFGIVFM